MIVAIQIPRAAKGLMLAHTDWPKAIHTAGLLLRIEQAKRAAKGKPELRLVALLDEVYKPARSLAALGNGPYFKMRRTYRVILDGAPNCEPVTRKVFIPKRKPASEGG